MYNILCVTFAMTFTFLIDSREKKIIEDFSLYEYDNVLVETLDLADIECRIDGNTVLLIERKTLNDLAASIKDGRYREQKMRLKASGINTFYLIEGIIRGTQKGSKINRLPTKTVISSILNMCIRDNIKMISTPSLHHTLVFLHQLYQKLKTKTELFLMEPKSSIPNVVSLDDVTHCLIKSQKKENMTPKICSIAQFAQIPGVSRVIAKGLVEQYGSVYGLCMVYMSLNTETDKENLLRNKSYVSYKGQIRPFGQHVSSQVYRFMCQ